MSRKITLININDVKLNTIVESNVDEKVITNAILEAQDLELQPVVGKVTLKRLKSEVEQVLTVSGYILSEIDKALIEDFIKPFLIYATLVAAFVPIHFKFTNKGIQKKSDSNSQTADTKELEMLRGHYTSKFENYKKRLIDYLAEDNDPTTNAEPNQDTTYGTTGWFLPDDDRCGLDDFYRRYRGY
jgi:hypothetical protein